MWPFRRKKRTVWRRPVYNNDDGIVVGTMTIYEERPVAKRKKG